MIGLPSEALGIVYIPLCFVSLLTSASIPLSKMFIAKLQIHRVIYAAFN